MNDIDRTDELVAYFANPYIQRKSVLALYVYTGGGRCLERGRVSEEETDTHSHLHEQKQGKKK